MRKFACVFMAAALAVSGLYAQYRDLGEVSVTAESWSPSALSPGGSVVIITAEDIAKSGAANVAEVLETVTGFKSDDSGYAGSKRTASIRGSTAAQVLVIVDGVRMNDSRQGYYDLSSLNLESIERIEVLKGGASSLYGADAVGGVIVITTKRGRDRKAVVTAENTMYPAAVGTDVSYLMAGQHLGVDGQTRVGNVGLSASASFNLAGDSFPSVNSDGSVNEVDHTGYLGGKASLGAEGALAGGILTASLAGNFTNMDVPSTAEQQNRSLHGTAAWSNDAIADGIISLNASAFGSWSRLAYQDSFLGTDSRHDTISAGTDLRVRVLPTSFMEIPAGLEFRYDAANSTDMGTPSRLHVGAYAAPILSLNQNVKVSPSLRYDWYDDYTAGLTYALGLSAAPTEALTLKLTGGRSYGAPSFNDLYWPFEEYDKGTYGYRTEGNPDLMPETSWFAEAGGEYAKGVVTASLFGYARYTTDLISWVSSFDGYWYSYVPENLAAAAFFGADAQATVDLGAFGVSVSYAYLLSYDLSDGATLTDGVRVANMPVHTIKLEPSYTAGPVQTSVRTSWRSKRYDSSGVTLDPLFLLGARVSLDLVKDISVYLEGENLLNADYQEVYGYPMPGMTLKMGVRAVL